MSSLVIEQSSITYVFCLLLDNLHYNLNKQGGIYIVIKKILLKTFPLSLLQESSVKKKKLNFAITMTQEYSNTPVYGICIK